MRCLKADFVRYCMLGTMDEDVQQRDFTLTALYYAPLKEQVVDYVNGVEGIKKEIQYGRYQGFYQRDI